MPTVNVLNIKGETVGKMELSDAVFGIEPNTTAMHAVVVNYLANQRQGTQSTKTRAEVSGGGKKPWRQKGTGRARQGSTRSPNFAHGGIAFGPKPRDYRYSLNKKLRRLAMKSALSSKVADGSIIVLDDIQLDEIKTKSMVEILSAVGFKKKALLVMPEINDKVLLSARNIAGVTPTITGEINVYDILNNNQMIIVKSAVEKLEEVYA
ncbi:MAG TPA: 50S ribosomal protein L4 [Oscillospiraceae bacterium]|nr:50S ribosomal protein L4 [Oscillospiraceae bacterium]HPF56099.1 50S ribosomal protein L4 [Clostridiales bacterium]HPK35067.1 50S ribosomal protein L4 [Oscillospiraceae bacterium]HPR75218.1 50S ribosomal protein L4 [Oscillospiraceae bacterium]